MGLFQSATSKHQEIVGDEYYFGLAANEIANGQISPGLHAKALAEADGDEQKTKARYIRLRVEMLKAESAAILEQVQRLPAEEKKNVQAVELSTKLSDKASEEAAAEAVWHSKTAQEKRAFHRNFFWGWLAATAVFILLSGPWNMDSYDPVDKLRAFFMLPAMWGFAMALLHLIESLKNNPRR